VRIYFRFSPQNRVPALLPVGKLSSGKPKKERARKQASLPDDQEAINSIILGRWGVVVGL